MSISLKGYEEGDIAIIGMACRFPEAEDLDDFWNNLIKEKECITYFSEEELRKSGVAENDLKDSRYVKASGCIDGIEYFDAKFFDYSPKEASLIDPQQRIFLEQAFLALEDAGCVPEKYEGSIGVYASAGMNTYLYRNLISHAELMEEGGGYPVMISNDKDFLATRVSYKLNLSGPSMTVQTACSSSMVAIHCACQALQNGECDCAVAGGVSVRVPQKTGYIYHEGLILSPDGHCRAFDQDAQGTVFGNGAGVIVLKMLSDAAADGDEIYAVIKGSAINNDGSLKAGYTAPGMESQAAVIYEAMSVAGINPSQISYVETHGTGTSIGDPIEIAALTRAYKSGEIKKNSCAIGSVKTNIGHLDTASGVAGVIKTALALKNKTLPASLNYKKPNPKIDFESSPFYVNTKTVPWEEEKGGRFAGVSSFGIGGTNAHIILQEPPKQQEREKCFARKQYMVQLSAKSETALKQKAKELVSYLEQKDVKMEDFCCSLANSRQEMKYRMAFVCESKEEAVAIMNHSENYTVFHGIAKENTQDIVFLFPGQGSQHVNMGLSLYQNEPVFRDTMNECFQILKELMGEDIKEILYPNEGKEEQAEKILKNTRYTQPALFIVEYSVAKLLISWGILPKAMAGHSLGEYVAACISGVLELKDALRLVVTRAGLIAKLAEGKMLSVMMEEKQVLPILIDKVSIAAINGEKNIVLSGETEAIEEMKVQLSNMGIAVRELETSHAFHSSMLNDILPAFEEEIKKIPFHAPQIPYISTCTGEWMKEEDAKDIGYWVKHLRHAVRFHQAASVLLENKENIYLEVGPGKTLSTFLKTHPKKENASSVFNTFPHQKEKKSSEKALCEMLLRIWISGKQIDWKKYYNAEEYQKIRIPTYPFDKRKYWISPGTISYYEVQKEEEAEGEDIEDRSELSSSYVAAENKTEETLVSIWEDVLGIKPIGVKDNFFELGGTSLMITQILSSAVKEFGDIAISVSEVYNHQTIRGLAEYIDSVMLLKNNAVLENYEEGEL